MPLKPEYLGKTPLNPAFRDYRQDYCVYSGPRHSGRIYIFNKYLNFPMYAKAMIHPDSIQVLKGSSDQDRQGANLDCWSPAIISVALTLLLWAQLFVGEFFELLWPGFLVS